MKMVWSTEDIKGPQSFSRARTRVVDMRYRRNKLWARKAAELAAEFVAAHGRKPRVSEEMLIEGLADCWVDREILRSTLGLDDYRYERQRLNAEIRRGCSKLGLSAKDTDEPEGHNLVALMNGKPR